jgi:hypothetical protein
MSRPTPARLKPWSGKYSGSGLLREMVALARSRLLPGACLLLVFRFFHLKPTSLNQACLKQIWFRQAMLSFLLKADNCPLCTGTGHIFFLMYHSGTRTMIHVPNCLFLSHDHG